MTKVIGCLTLLAFAISTLAFAQGPSSIDGGAFVEFSLGAISSMSQQDRRGGRDMIAHQIAALPTASQVSAINALFSKMRSDNRLRDDIAAILANFPMPWSSSDTNNDAQYIYALVQQTSDDSSRNILDSALSNAAGLYKDGIRDFNGSNLAQFVHAEGKFKAMVNAYPNSRYAENAFFYLGQFYTKAFLLNDPRGSALLATSNATLEDYVVKADAGKLGGKKSFLPAGFFFRALNSWLSGNLNDARKWLLAGQAKFQDTDRIYIYQLFFSPGDQAAVIDQFLPARPLFTTTYQFLSGNPAPVPAMSHADELAALIKIP